LRVDEFVQRTDGWERGCAGLPQIFPGEAIYDIGALDL
jgi:hypothetical protein